MTALAVLEGVTAGLRERPGLAAVSVHEVAAHLTGGLWLAPGEPVLEFNTSLFHMAVIVAFVIAAGAWSGYPVMNRAFPRRQS